MKKYGLFLLVLAVSVFFFTRGSKEEAPSKSVFRIGMECDYAPNNWEAQKPSEFSLPIANHEGFFADGYDLQIARLVAKELNLTLEVRKIAWNDLIPALLRGEIDAIFSGMLDTDERKKQAAFSIPYEVQETEYAVVVNTESPYAEAKNMTDFGGAKFTGQKDTKLYTTISQLPGAIALPPVDTVSEMIDAVPSMKVDAIVINLDTGRSYEAAYDNLRVVRFPENHGFVLGFSGICAGVRKNDTKLLNGINGVLEKTRRSDRQKIMDNTVARLWKSL